MASMTPLPQLQPMADPMEQYSRLVVMRNAVQEQQQRAQQMAYQKQMQPMELQAQENVLTKQRQELQDTRAGQAAYAAWDGKDYNDLAHLTIQHGGSVASAQRIAAFGLDQLKTTSEILKNKGEGAQATANAMKTNADYAAGQFDSLNGLPDEQLPQAFAQTLQTGLDKGWIDPQHAQLGQQIAQQPAAQIRQMLPYVVKSYTSESQQVERALKVAQTGKEQAETITAQQAGQLGQLQADARNQYLAANPNKNVNDYLNLIAGQKKAAEEAGAFPYQAKLASIREQINNTFWNNKDAMSEVENKYLVPYQQKMSSINELKSAVQLASQGNVAAARGTVLKLMGVSNPDGTKRYNEAEARNMLRMGSVPQRFQGTVQDLLTGNNWTPQMAADINSYADAQGAVAQNSLNSGIDSINTLHGTKIGQGLKGGATGGGGGGGEPTAVGPNGHTIVFRNGQWTDPNTGQAVK